MPRISRGHFPNHKPTDLSTGFYSSIFTRDVHTGIVPYRSSRRGDSEFKVSMNKSNQRLESQLKDFFYVGHHSSWNFPDTVTDAIETLSQYLVTFGEVYLEVVDTKDMHKDGVTDKELKFLPLGRVYRIFNKYIQLVPFSDWKNGEKKAYIIPAERIWHLKLPRELGSPRSHRRLLSRLKNLSEPMPTFTKNDGILGASVHYDFSLHHDQKELAVEQLTASWGSIPSLRQIKHTTEYYYIIRNLQFSYSQAILREHITDEMNKLLQRLNVNNSIKVEGLAHSSEINEAMKKLNRGDIGFTEALKAAKV